MVKKRWQKILLIVIILAVAGGFYYMYYYRGETASREEIDPRMIMEVERGNLKKTIAAGGYVKAIHEENLSFPVKSTGSTRIEIVNIEEGDRVEKGQLLMELNKTEARLNYTRKLNAYNQAKINGSPTQVKEAELELELARDELENMELKAPFAGIITEIHVEEGDYYTSGDVLTIKDVSRLEVEVNIGESDIPEIRPGQRAEVTLESLPGKNIDGRVSEIENEADNSGGTVTLPVTVLLDKVDYDIKLNCSADLDIIVEEVEDKVWIPITALLTGDGQESVIRVVDGKQQTVQVTTGLSDGLRIAVESGLQPGDKIIRNTYRQAEMNHQDNGERRTGVHVSGGG